MTDISPENVARHLDLSHNHEAGLIPVATQNLLRALSARLAEVEADLAEAEEDLTTALEKLAAAEAKNAKLREALLFIASRKPSEAPTGPKDGNGHCAWTAYHTARAALQGDKT